MLRRMLAALALIALAACVQAQARDTVQAPANSAAPQSGPQELLDKMVGRWTLTGVIAGQNTVHDVDAEWVLQHNYVRISEVSRERAENGQPQYEAFVLVGWSEAAHQYVCFWFDNTGVADPHATCSAPHTPDVIPFEFRNASGALDITNTFTYDRVHDTWQWRMDNVINGQPAHFGTVTLRRQ